MILQELTSYYDILAEKGKVPLLGWSQTKAAFALNIDGEGNLLDVTPLVQERQIGKKTVEEPIPLVVPAQKKKAQGIDSNFLCDTSSYMLGFDDKGKPSRTQKCFECAKQYHHQILANVDDPAAQAVCQFFSAWQPENAREHPALSEHYEEMLKGRNIVFRYRGRFVHEEPPIRSAWEHHYHEDGEVVEMRCLVTGEYAPIARLHPSIKGVRGGQPSGTSLISYNAPAYESYGRENGAISPVSKQACFAYGTTLNYLLSDRKHKEMLGDTTVLLWSEQGHEAAEEFSQMAIFSNFNQEEQGITEKELVDMVSSLAKGQRVDFHEEEIDPQNRFFLLGLAPNASRLSVRFFLVGTLGDFMRRIDNHYRRLEIIRPPNTMERLSFWHLLQETVNQKSRDKSPAPLLGGALFRAVLSGTPYPSALLNGVMLRLRAEQQISYRRAAIIKAYWLTRGSEKNKEAFTVSLNESTNNVPYVLGRLFSVLENAQEAANPGINSTIKDKYFNSASATPASIFPVLLNLSNSHLRKMEKGFEIHFSKQLGSLMDKLQIEDAAAFPKRLNLEEQGAFYMGYYHQTQKRYEKKKQED